MNKIYENIVLSKEFYQKQLNYWQKKAKEKINPVNNLSTNFKEDKIKEIKFTLPYNVADSALKLCKNNDVALFAELMCSYKILLYKYNQQNQIVITAPVLSGNNEPKYNDRILFTRKVDDEESFKSMLINESKDIAESYKNQYYPIDEYVNEIVNNESDLSYIFKFGIELKNIHKENVFSKYNINILLTFERNEDLINAKLTYNECLFNEKNANDFIRSFINTLNFNCSSVDSKVKDINILDEDQTYEIINKFNSTDKQYDNNVPIVRMFEDAVNKYKNKNAVVFKDKVLTYNELNIRCNKVARHLLSRKINKEEIIGIISDNSINMIISMLSILKAGGAYLPIDPLLPVDRQDYIIKSSGISKILISGDYTNNINSEVEYINIDSPEIENNSQDNLDICIDLTDIIYTIYTSGTTGAPKGVVIQNKSLVNYVKWVSHFANITNNDKAALISSGAFDLGYTTIYSSLINGCELHVLNKEMYSEPKYLSKYFWDNKITYSKMTPTLFGLINMFRDKSIEGIFDSLRLIILGGESINCLDIEKFHQLFPNTEFINHYGPTETTIGCIAHKIEFDKFEQFKQRPVIGRPIDNNKVYILDKNLEPVPIGMSGEIYVSGCGLAKAYLNDSNMTDKKFINNPFIKDAKMYKTGDIGKFNINGEIEYVGRVDNQVKISGYRVDIREIENIILKYNAVEGVFVTTIEEEQNKKLIAYIVGNEVDIIELRNYIKGFLPSYMIPAYFIKLDKLPVTLNGKVDKSLLPKPDLNNMELEYVAPRNELENTIAQAWQDILKVKQVGIYNDYFDLGGDSIKAIQISSILKSHNIDLKVSDILEHTTINELSEYAVLINNNIDQGMVSGEVELTPIQKRFFEFKFKNSNHWNQSIMIYREEGFDEQGIRKVFEKIIQHHDALRMSYKLEGDTIQQINREINDTNLFELEVFNFENSTNINEEILEKCNLIQSQLDLGKGPLIRAGLFKTMQGSHLLIAAHHLIIDGVSWRIILSDISRGYKQYLQNSDINFQEKTNSFKEWAEELKRYSVDSKLLNELEYWKCIENKSALDLPIKFNDVEVGLNKECKKISVCLSEQQTQCLIKDINKTYNTEINDILVTALGYTLSKWIKDTNILINLEGHGRQILNSNIDINRTVGWFTSIFPIILEMNYCDDMGKQIRTIKEMLRNIPNKGIGYGILRYLTPKEYNDDLKLNPRVCFNYLGEVDNIIDDEVFKLSELSTGNLYDPNSRSQYLIHINAMIKENKFCIEFTYDSSNILENEIELVSNNYKEELLKIINHCMNTHNQKISPSDVVYNKLSIDELDELVEKYSEDSKEIQDIFNVPPMQAGFYMMGTSRVGEPISYQCRIFTINKELNIDEIQAAYDSVVVNHDILRSIYVCTKSKKIAQIIYKDFKQNIIYKDISDLSEENKDKYFEDLREKDRYNFFDFEKGDFNRIHIIKFANSKYKVLWSNNHVLIDGWSRMILFKEFYEALQKIRENKSVIIKDDSYKNYLLWLNNQDDKEAKKYWDNLLKDRDKSPVIDYIDGNDESVPMVVGERERVLEGSIINDLNTTTAKHHVTITSIMFAAYAVALKKYANKDDITFTTPVSGRNLEIKDVSNIAGMLMNIIPIRVKFREDSTFKEIVEIIKNQLSKSEKYNYYSDEETLDPYILGVGICFENYPIDNFIMDLFFESGIITDFEMPDQQVLDLGYCIIPLGDKIVIKMVYNTLKVREELADWQIESMLKIIDIANKNIDINVEDIELDYIENALNNN